MGDEVVGKVKAIFDGDASGVQQEARKAQEAVKQTADSVTKAGREMATGMDPVGVATAKVSAEMVRLVKDAMAAASAGTTLAEKTAFARRVFEQVFRSAEQFDAALAALGKTSKAAAEGIEKVGDRAQRTGRQARGAGEDVERSTRHVKEAESVWSSWGGRLTQTAAALFTFQQAARAARAGVEAFLDPIRQVSDLQDFAQSVGSTAAELSRLQYAAREGGLKDGETIAALTALTGKLEEAKDKTSLVAAQFKALGVDMSQGAVPALLQVVDALNKLPDQRKAVELSRALLGPRSGNRFLAILQDQSVLRDAVRSGQTVSDRFAEAADRIGDKWERLKGSFESFRRQGVEPLLAPLERAEDRLTKFFQTNERGIQMSQAASTALGKALDHLTQPENLDRLGGIAEDLSGIAGSLLSIGASAANSVVPVNLLSTTLRTLAQTFKDLPPEIQGMLTGAAIGAARGGAAGAGVGTIVGLGIGAAGSIYEKSANVAQTTVDMVRLIKIAAQAQEQRQPGESLEDTLNRTGLVEQRNEIQARIDARTKYPLNPVDVAIFGPTQRSVAPYTPTLDLKTMSAHGITGPVIPTASGGTTAAGGPGGPPTRAEQSANEQTQREAAARGEATAKELEAQRAHWQAILQTRERALSLAKEEGASEATITKLQESVRDAKSQDLNLQEKALLAQRAQFEEVANVNNAIGVQVEAQIRAQGEIRRIDGELLAVQEKRKWVEQDITEESIRQRQEAQQAAILKAQAAANQAEQREKDLSARSQQASRNRGGGSQPTQQEIALAKQLDDAEQKKLLAKRNELQVQQDAILNGRQLSDLSELERAKYDAIGIQIAGVNQDLERGGNHIRDLNAQLDKTQQKFSAIGASIDLIFGKGPLDQRLQAYVEKFTDTGLDRAKEMADKGGSLSAVWKAFKGQSIMSDSGGGSSGSLQDALDTYKQGKDLYSQFGGGAAGTGAAAESASFGVQGEAGGLASYGSESGLSSMMGGEAGQLGVGGDAVSGTSAPMSLGGGTGAASGAGMGGAMNIVGLAFKAAETINEIFDWTRQRRKDVDAAKDIPGVSQEQIIEANLNKLPFIGSYLKTGNALTANLFGEKLGGEINSALLQGGGMNKLFGFNLFSTPNGENQLNRSLNKYLEQAGLRDLQILEGRRGINLRDTASIKGGGAISVPSDLAGVGGIAGGLYSLSMSGTKIPEKEKIGGRVANFLRNAVAGLGLSADTADSVVARFEKPLLGQNLDEAVLKLAKYRAQGKLTGEDVAKYMGRSLQIFTDLPRSIDASTVALAGFTDDGRIALERLKQAGEDATAVIAEGTKSAFLDLVKSSSAQQAAIGFTDKFVSTIEERMAERLTSQLLAPQLSQAIATAEKAVDAAVSGNMAKAERLLNQARGEFIAGRTSVISQASPIAAMFRQFEQSLNIGTSNIINMQGYGMGGGNLFVPQAGYPQALDRYTSGMNGQPVQVTIVDRTQHVLTVDGSELARVNKDNTRLDRNIGVVTPDPNLGVRKR